MDREHDSLKSSDSSRSSINSSIISFKFEESRHGVGLWDGDGLLSTIGFPVALDNETPATIASLLKNFLSSVKGEFVPSGFWDKLDSIAVANKNSPPNPETIEKIQFEIEQNCPSREHLHTFSYFVLHLQRVADKASTNMMTAKNLALCVFVTAKEGGEYIIRYADLIFGNIDMVGRETVASLPYSETPSLFPELEDDSADLPPWDSTMDDLEPLLMKQWFQAFSKKSPKSTGTASVDPSIPPSHCLSPILTKLTAEFNNNTTLNSLVVSSANATTGRSTNGRSTDGRNTNDKSKDSVNF
ncbi:hypothetical protein BCR33DRAFT_454426 [Rhizoclosmatium globosum]|uniref:Rho-GAP domain-containing protein n=1 Tax=Rhizoclosmatium globosum TaxID=329046 RepID=A0A1Y2CWK5_9FUNG|nr:hypothetical protein BCR33DRAFT_454426 [Rhizoclosmatium globosum]|eukprot:ORY51421.1 hypothetical protein BCR33DRAFT_454426 [Rhizoclosmatium globosum]